MIPRENYIEDRFGFLFSKVAFELKDFEINPLDDYDKTKEWIKAHTNWEKYYCPPINCSDDIHRLPPSHLIIIKKDFQSDLKSLRLGKLGFLIHLLGYMYGYRFQFHDWWFDKRLPTSSQHNIHFYNKDLIGFLEHALAEYEGWDGCKRKLFTNLLYMHTRGFSYYWDWERFMLEYIVFDGCWKFFANEQELKNVIKHAERLRVILSHFRMVVEDEKIFQIVNLRNELFHESLWEGGTPGSSHSENSFFASYWLRRINQRLFPALLKYRTKYIESNWVCFGTYDFVA